MSKSAGSSGSSLMSLGRGTWVMLFVVMGISGGDRVWSASSFTE